MSEQLVTNEMAAALRRLQFDPTATPTYEGLSGGLVWPDEWSEELSRACSEAPPGKKYVCRYLWAYRASMIRGCPDDRLADLWQALLVQFPGWPGFQSSRRSPEHRAELERMEAAFLRNLEEEWK